ncbi:MAG TPA: CBS domain-containing protein, partial [Clostridiales bacterium]|nr:CBS domain-containing protein [Clostridiales bacterium]
MKVRDVMTQNVVSVYPEATVAQTADLMRRHNIGAVPVCDPSGLTR